jgi:pimeloyl-ACP methyl ester carboxylesterase
VAGARLAYQRIGSGEPLLFLSNIAVPTPELGAFAPFFNAAGYELVLVDHLGPDHATVEAMAAHLGELLDILDLRPWVWGYSQGAFLAQELSLLRPGRVRGAVLVATRGRPDRFFTEYAAACGDIDAGALPDRVAGAFYLLAMMSPDLLCDDDRVSHALQEVRRSRRTVDPDRARRSAWASATYGDRLAALSAVRVPCLVMAFERDVVCPPRLGREVAAAIPGCEYREVPDAGHGGLVSHAAEVLVAATEFLDRHRDQQARRR